MDGDNNLDVALQTVQIAKLHKYRMSGDNEVAGRIDIHIFRYYFQLIQLRQSLNEMTNNRAIKQAPHEIGNVFIREFGYLYLNIDKLIVDIDNMFAKYWIFKFNMDNTMDSNLKPLDTKIIPKMYLYENSTTAAEYKILPFALEVISAMKVDNLIRLSVIIDREAFEGLGYLKRLHIISKFSARHTTLKNICARTGSHISPNLYVLSSSKIPLAWILTALVKGLNLKKNTNHDECILAFITYLHLLENDLEIILKNKLPSDKAVLSFKVPGLKENNLLIPTHVNVPDWEINKKINKIQKPLLFKRNIFLSILGAASETKRLENSLALKNLQDVTYDLKQAQHQMAGEYKKFLGSRIQESEVLTNIGQHIDALERTESNLNLNFKNVTHAILHLSDHMQGYMILNLGLYTLGEEIRHTERGLKRDQVIFNTALTGKFPINSQFIVNPPIISAPYIALTKEGLSITAGLSIESNKFNDIRFKVIPMKYQQVYMKFDLPLQLITNYEYKVAKEDLHLCDHGLKTCPADVSLNKLTECETYLLLKRNFTKEVEKDCISMLVPSSLKSLQYIHVPNGVIIHNPQPREARRLCDTNAHTLTISPGLEMIQLKQGCQLHIGDTILKGSNYVQVGKVSNFDFYDDKMASALTNLSLHANFTVFNMNRNATNGLSTGMSDLMSNILSYTRLTNMTPRSYSYDKASWEALHPIEILGHVGPPVLTLILMIGTISLCVIVFCCRKRIRKFCCTHAHAPYPNVSHTRLLGGTMGSDISNTLPHPHPTTQAFIQPRPHPTSPPEAYWQFPFLRNNFGQVFNRFNPYWSNSGTGGADPSLGMPIRSAPPPPENEIPQEMERGQPLTQIPAQGSTVDRAEPLYPRVQVANMCEEIANTDSREEDDSTPTPDRCPVDSLMLHA